MGAAGSSAAGSAQACTSGAARLALMRSSALSPGQSGKKREGRMNSVPFPHPLGAPASPEVRVECPARRHPVKLSLPVRGGEVAWLCPEAVADK